MSSAADGEEYKLPKVELRQFAPLRATEPVLDCWRTLQRASVDVATLSPSDRNVFAFADSCLYLATVHDMDFALKAVEEIDNGAKERETTKERSRVGRGWWNDEDHDMDELLEKEYQNSSSSSANNTTSTTGALPHDDGSAPGSGASTSAPNAEPLSETPQIDPDAAWMNGPDVPPKNKQQSNLIGIAYLTPATGTASASAEVSLGIALLPHARGKGFGTEAVRLLLGIAFDSLVFHRVSASVLGPCPTPLRRPLGTTPGSTADKIGSNAMSTAKEEGLGLSGTLAETEAALRMFVGLGFILEGTRRRAVPDPDDNGAWRDVHDLATLDTEWFAFQRRPLPFVRRTRWDEMLARHQSETEALASAESRLKRSASTETLRPINGAEIGIAYVPSLSASSAASECESSAERHRSPACVGSSASSSASVAISNPFRDPSPAQRTDAPRVFLHSDACSQSDAEGSEADYGEVCYSAARHASVDKVASFLRAHPAPGPPPSEIGSNLDSEAESDFESCADPDELDVLRDGKGKEKERAVADEQGSTVLDSTAEMSQQARKKRRLLDASESVSSTNSHAASASIPTPLRMISTPYSFNGTSSSFNNTPLRPANPTNFSLLSRANVGANRRSPDDGINADMDTDIETASIASTATSTSAWDVVSGGARSPSPSRSLLSGTGSLSLQSASESEEE